MSARRLGNDSHVVAVFVEDGSGGVSIRAEFELTVVEDGDSDVRDCVEVGEATASVVNGDAFPLW